MSERSSQELFSSILLATSKFIFEQWAVASQELFNSIPFAFSKLIIALTVSVGLLTSWVDGPKNLNI